MFPLFQELSPTLSAGLNPLETDLPLSFGGSVGGFLPAVSASTRGWLRPAGPCSRCLFWGGNTGKAARSLGFLLAQVPEPFLLLGEKPVNRTNALHNGVLTCFSFLAALTPRETGASLSRATQTGSPLPRAACDAERGFFSCCSISMESLDSALSLAPLSLAGRGQLIPSVQLPSWLKLIL